MEGSDEASKAVQQILDPGGGDVLMEEEALAASRQDGLEKGQEVIGMETFNVSVKYKLSC